MDFGPFGLSEVVFIGLLALVVFGPRRLPELARSVGGVVTALRRGIRRLAKRQRTWFRGMERRGIPVTRIAPDDAARAKIRLLRDCDPKAPSDAEVPDPYYGGADGFDLVLDICMAACQGLLAELSQSGGTTDAER